MTSMSTLVDNGGKILHFTSICSPEQNALSLGLCER